MNITVMFISRPGASAEGQVGGQFYIPPLGLSFHTPCGYQEQYSVQQVYII